ncbi:MAG: insulinase family protein [Planctomycetales bacterium]|nr:insulinase family protein [bacterium]UNM08990.1 MAG: insulinase family protein [Planctomycetales bacterium]
MRTFLAILGAVLFMSTVAYADDVREYKLDNGLLVLLKENHNAPVINLNVVYRVGSKYERPGITGISHLLEHLMFKTTKNFPLGEFDRRLKAVGADNNAYTWLDQTVYYETIASHEIDIALELEADRMSNLSCLPEDHEFEMQVVRNELEQREDNPMGRLYEELISNAFKAHPYGIPTIGWVDDVEGIQTSQIADYYHTWYHPDNAFIVAVGDFDSDEMFAKIEQYFGSIPAGGVEHPRLPQEPKQLGERRFKLRQAGQLDYLMAGWHVPESEHPDAYPLVVLGNILGSGRTSRLYKALVDSGMAAGAQAESSAFGYQDPFLFMAFAVANPGVDTAGLEKVLYDEIQKIKDEGVTEAELARAKKQARVAFVFDKDSIENEARSLVDFELMSNWRDVDNYLPSIEAVSNEDVMRVANQYLVDDNRTVGVFEAIKPEAPMLGGTGPDGVEPPSFRPQFIAPHYRPQAAGNHISLQAAAASDTSVVQLGNGITLVLRENHNNSTVSVSGVVPAGSVNDPVDRRGLGNMVVSMLSNGTTKHSKAELAEIMEDSGIALGFSPARESFSFSGRSLTEDFGLLLDMLAEQLLEPSFPEDELELTRQQVLTAIFASENETMDESFVAGRALLYGEDHPFSGRIEGRSADVEAITVADLIGWYGAHVVPAGTVISIVGDIDAAAAEAMVRERFSAWQGGGADRAGLLAQSAEFQSIGGQNLDIDMPDKSNVSLLWIGPGCSKAGSDWPARLVANFIMGGDFSSRLNNRLRLKDGLTYGAYSFFSNGAASGPWAAVVQVNPANIDAAVAATNEELAKISSEGITAEELELAKSYLTGNFPVRLSTNGAVASLLTDSLYLGKGAGYIEDYESIINAVTLEQVNAAAAEFMDPARLATVVCGTLVNNEGADGE